MNWRDASPPGRPQSDTERHPYRRGPQGHPVPSAKVNGRAGRRANSEGRRVAGGHRSGPGHALTIEIPQAMRPRHSAGHPANGRSNWYLAVPQFAPRCRSFRGSGSKRRSVTLSSSLISDSGRGKNSPTRRSAGVRTSMAPSPEASPARSRESRTMSSASSIARRCGATRS